MRLFNFAVVAAGLMLAGFAGAAEEKVPLENVPTALKESLKKRFPKGELTAATKDTVNGKTTFEVALKVGETKYDVNLTDAGVVTGFEKQVAIKDLPKVVVDAAAAAHPKAPMKHGEMVYKVADGKETFAYYEVIVTVDGKDVEVEVMADGTLKPAEKK